MSMQVGLQNSGSEAQSDSSSSGSVTVKLARAFSGGSWAWTARGSKTTREHARYDFMWRISPWREHTQTSANTTFHQYTQALLSAPLELVCRKACRCPFWAGPLSYRRRSVARFLLQG